MTANEMHDKILALWFYSDKDWSKTYKNIKDGDYPEEFKAQLRPPFVIERKEEE